MNFKVPYFDLEVLKYKKESIKSHDISVSFVYDPAYRNDVEMFTIILMLMLHKLHTSVRAVRTI